MYILLCSNGTYYTGSTIDLQNRIKEHELGKGANHTKKHLPIELVYFEEYVKVSDAFKREKQVQKWRREKKEALINGDLSLLPVLAKKVFIKHCSTNND
jgi:putative endonuclease